MEDQRYFRDVVRRTRMIYDSLRILSLMEDEKRWQSLSHSLSQSQSQSQNSNPNPSPTPGEELSPIPPLRRVRGDLRAASVMRDRRLWLNRDKRIVGSIPGVYIGDLFFFRMELCLVLGFWVKQKSKIKKKKNTKALQQGLRPRLIHTA